MNWIIGLVFLVLLGNSQNSNICQNSFYTSTNNFIFNNQGCQGFSYNNTLTPNPNFGSINCLNSNNCWYQITSNSTQINAYLFCNTTLSGCSVCNLQGQNGCVTCFQCYGGYFSNTYNTTGNCQNCQPCSANCTSCPNGNTCNNCNNGYFLNLYNTTNMYFNCQACSAGCQTCPSASNCTTCYPGYYFYVYNPNQTLQNCVLCNFTFPGCNSCFNNLTCTQCSPGYYLYVYNLIMSYSNCQPCSSVIPGCMYCNSQTSCQQCNSEFLNVNGQCYNQNGVLVSGIDPFTSGGSKTAQIIMDVFIGLILLAIIYAFCVFFVQKRFTPRPSYVSREPVRIDNTEINQPKRFTEMRETQKITRNLDDRHQLQEKASTSNADQYITEPGIRDELVKETSRTISPK